MIACSKNLFKQLKKIYQTKTNREMLQHGFLFFASNEFFLLKKVIKYSLFMFFFFSHLCKISNQKNKVIMTCVFECFQSHRHILKDLHEFLP